MIVDDRWRLVVLVVLALHEAGKALTHTTRGLAWAHAPLFDGLAISDLWHAFSAAQWPAVFLLGWLAFGRRWRLWLVAVASWAIVWQLAKMVAGKAWLPWWLQLYEFAS